MSTVSPKLKQIIAEEVTKAMSEIRDYRQYTSPEDEQRKAVMGDPAKRVNASMIMPLCKNWVNLVTSRKPLSSTEQDTLKKTGKILYQLGILSKSDTYDPSIAGDVEYDFQGGRTYNKVLKPCVDYIAQHIQ